MSKRSFIVALFSVLALPSSLFAQVPSLTVQVDHPTAKVSLSLAKTPSGSILLCFL
jgi:hypothetical protein